MIKCMDKENLSGQREKAIREAIKMTLSMVLER